MPRCLPDVARSIARLARGKNRGWTSTKRARFISGRVGISVASRSKGGEMNESSSAPERRVRQGMDYGETAEVNQVHAAIQREKREPRMGLEPLSLWLIAIYGLAIFCGGAYLGRYSGNFSGDGLDPLGGAPRPPKPGQNGPGGTQTQELSQADRGKKIFSANCATCHQMSGMGVTGQYPPPAGSEYVNGGTRLLGMSVLQ